MSECEFPHLDLAGANNVMGIAKLAEFINGDDGMEPDAFDNLQAVGDAARALAKRALAYAAKCDAMLRTTSARP